MRWTFGCDLSGARWLCTFLLCASVTLTHVASAQEAGSTQEQADPPGYQALLRQAQSEYRHGNHVEARQLFEDAHRRLPTARTLRGLGVSEFELHQYLVSIDHLERALESTVRPLESRQRKQAEALLERAYEEVARLHVAIEPTNAEAQLIVDGKSQERRGDRPLLLEPGEHQLEFRAAGYLHERRPLHIARGAYEIWHVALTRAPAPSARTTPAVAQADASPEPPTPSEVAQLAQPAPVSTASPDAFANERPTAAPLYKSPWLWAGIGVAVAAGALAFGIMASRETRVLHGEAVQTPNTQGVLSALGVSAP